MLLSEAPLDNPLLSHHHPSRLKVLKEQEKREKHTWLLALGENFPLLPDSLWCESILHSTCKDISCHVEKTLVVCSLPKTPLHRFLPSHLSPVWNCPVKPVLRDILSHSSGIRHFPDCALLCDILLNCPPTMQFSMKKPQLPQCLLQLSNKLLWALHW